MDPVRAYAQPKRRPGKNVSNPAGPCTITCGAANAAAVTGHSHPTDAPSTETFRLASRAHAPCKKPRKKNSSGSAKTSTWDSNWAGRAASCTLGPRSDTHAGNVNNARPANTARSRRGDFGTSLADTLRVHADTLRVQRMQRAEELAGKAPLKMLFPTLLIFAGYLAVTVAVGLWASRRNLETQEDFFLGGREISAFSMALSAVSSGRSAWLVLGASGATWSMGVSALWLFPGYIIAESLMFTTIGPRLRARSSSSSHES